MNRRRDFWFDWSLRATSLVGLGFLLIGFLGIGVAVPRGNAVGIIVALALVITGILHIKGAHMLAAARPQAIAFATGLYCGEILVIGVLILHSLPLSSQEMAVWGLVSVIPVALLSVVLYLRGASET